MAHYFDSFGKDTKDCGMSKIRSHRDGPAYGDNGQIGGADGPEQSEH